MIKEQIEQKYGLGFRTVVGRVGDKIDISERIAKAYSDGAIDTTKELQKENENLRTDNQILQTAVGDFSDLQDKYEEEQRKNNGLEEQLSKAKETIKKLCGAIRALNNPNTHLTDVNGFLQEAEAFVDKEI